MGIYTDLQEKAKTDPDGVIHDCAALLNKNHEDSLALFLLGQIYAEAEHFGMAYTMFDRITRLRPDKAEAWNNLGMSCEGRKDHQESMKHFRRAWSIEKRATYASNIGNAFLSRQDYNQATEWAEKALTIDKECKSAKAVLAIASLSLGNWARGWDNYDATLGGKFRKETQYQDEERWDGTPGKSLIVYGEQGLGDEIMYASCIPDVSKDNQVVLECDKRLEGLFRRSFPHISVYGTRRDPADWLGNHKFDARVSCGTLPKFYRRKKEDFPGTPYLVADPERVTQWKALFGDKKPNIGICWSGGSKHNKPQARAIGLEAFRPLIESTYANFYSLQYKDPTDEIAQTGLPVKHYKRACESLDYDDTAGFVGALDLVIGVHTTAHHLAGALGIPGIILVPDQTLWLYENGFPWYTSATLFKKRQSEGWQGTVNRLLKDDLWEKSYGCLPGSTNAKPLVIMPFVSQLLNEPLSLSA